MIERNSLLAMAALLLAICAGCRLSKDDVIGQYSLVAEGQAESLAMNVGSDGTFTLYRPIHGVTRDWSGSGTWELINPTFLGPGDEAIYLKSARFMGAVIVTRRDGRVSLNVEKNDEYWCKPK